MRVLVTGHQGYLGTVMVPILQAAGHEVIGLDTGWFADCLLGAFAGDPEGLRLDLRSVRIDALRGFDAVVHLAALSNDPWARSRRKSPTKSTIAPRCVWLGSRKKPVCPGSCTPPPARCTVPPETNW